MDSASLAMMYPIAIGAAIVRPIITALSCLSTCLELLNRVVLTWRRMLLSSDKLSSSEVHSVRQNDFTLATAAKSGHVPMGPTAAPTLDRF